MRSGIENALFKCAHADLVALRTIIEDGLQSGQGAYNDESWEQALEVMQQLKRAISTHAKRLNQKRGEQAND